VLDDGVLVQLDVRHLRFADVAALRLLGRFARQAQRAGHRVTTRGAGKTLREVADPLGVADDLGLS
jgi:ABC-type transporter Mla MlaB component